MNDIMNMNECYRNTEEFYVIQPSKKISDYKTELKGHKGQVMHI